MATQSVHFSNKSDCWETPQGLFALLDDEFEFTTDVCAEPHSAKCAHYYTPAIDGLSQPWAGVCWCNPPYSDSASWIRKAFAASRDGTVVVCLIPARTDTRYWHDYVMKADEDRLVKGRLRFVGGRASAPFPSAVVVFRPTPRPRADHPVVGLETGGRLTGVTAHPTSTAGGRRDRFPVRQAVRRATRAATPQDRAMRLTVKAAAELAGVSASPVYTWCQEERLPHYRLGAEGKRGRIAIDRADLERFLETCRTERHPLLAADE